ncbi:hypothetical protein MN608_00901 [Microdochium nivale]|nr:hypothetical protein MN608_00901 [Microdochium nivale]
MMRNGSTGGNITPTAFTSATAIGYLPQYSGHAAASLMPSIPNAQSLVCTSSTGKHANIDKMSCLQERLGENRPPVNGCTAESEAAKDLHARLQRDDDSRVTR